MRNADAAVNIADLESLARRRLPKVVTDYLVGGAEDELTLRRNREAFARIEFVPRVLSGHGDPDLSVDLFGTRYAAPFLIGPTGLNGLFWRDGDLHLARAAAQASVGFTLSSASNISLEDIADQVAGPKWFQLYPWGEPTLPKRLIDRARSAGYETLVVTVDALTPGRRERDVRNNFAHEVRIGAKTVIDGLSHPGWLGSVWLRGGMPRMENLAEFVSDGADGRVLAEFMRVNRNPYFCWSDVERLREHWMGPMVIKGLMSPEDIGIARRIGIEGVVVSNHGGRQLDGAMASIDALPEVVAAAGSSMVVLVDSGFRRGSDIVKALALGADGVLLGRATLFGLAAAGQTGVDRAIGILREEVSRVLALLGCPSVAALSGDYLRIDSAAGADIDHGHLNGPEGVLRSDHPAHAGFLEKDAG